MVTFWFFLILGANLEVQQKFLQPKNIFHQTTSSFLFPKNFFEKKRHISFWCTEHFLWGVKWKFIHFEFYCRILSVFGFFKLMEHILTQKTPWNYKEKIWPQKVNTFHLFSHFGLCKTRRFSRLKKLPATLVKLEKQKKPSSFLAGSKSFFLKCREKVFFSLWMDDNKNQPTTFMWTEKPQKKTLLFLCWPSVKHHKFKQQVLLLFIKVFLSFSKRTKKKSVNMTVTYFLFLWETSNIHWCLISMFSEQFCSKTFIIASWGIKFSKSWSLVLKRVPHG